MKIQTLLDARGVRYKESKHRPTFTSQGMAAQEHVSGYNVAKPVIVRGDLGYAMCVVPACARVDLERVAEVLQEFDVRLASEEEMADLFPDCELGAEPPVGALYGLKTIVDERLHHDRYVLMQAGTHTEAIEIRRDEWEKLCKPIVAEISVPPTPPVDPAYRDPKS